MRHRIIGYFPLKALEVETHPVDQINLAVLLLVLIRPRSIRSAFSLGQDTIKHFLVGGSGSPG
jgi:hypothetical protein